jgi:hypothetical protein
MAYRRIALLAVAAGLAGAIGALAARRSPPQRQPGAEQETYRCQCGTAYRVSGTDRHRVYWLADAAESDPVLGTACVNCEAPLPAGRALATA